MSREILKLATKYAGFSAIQERLETGVQSLEFTYSAALSTAEHMEVDSTELEAAFAVIEKFMNEQDKALRAEIKKIREALEGCSVDEPALPRVAAVMWHLSDVAKHRTSVENARDVLEAICAAGVKGGE